MSFANPAGAWALLAIAAVLAIHLLQRRRRRIRVSTLFLLQRAPSASFGGRRLERLRRSASLWLQLAAAALLAFVLMLPQRLRDDSRQKVVVVLDSTLSMSAFVAPVREAVARRTAELAARAARTDWVLVESAAGRRPLYAGTEEAVLRRALASWEPRDGHHDAGAAIENARALGGAEGLVVFVTDHEAPVPEGVERLSVGRPLDNVGIAGLEVDTADGETRIRAVVRNHGRTPARRPLWVETGTTRSEARVLDLAAAEVRVLSLPFPASRDDAVVALEPDGFTLDDRAPVVRPQRKRLRVRLTEDNAVVRGWLATFDAVDVSEPADIVLGPGADERAPSAVQWRRAGDTRLAGAPRISERHPLVSGLSWQGLLAPESTGTDIRDGDQVLVWSGARPLVFLRGPRRLHLDFPIAGSNAERVPAVLLLLHRFVEDVRRVHVGPEQRNVECGQELAVALRAGDGELRANGDARVDVDGTVRAPWRPSLFEVHAGTDRRLRAAAFFADVREADFSEATSSHLRIAEGGELRRRHTRDDPLMPLYLAALCGLLLADWGFASRRAG